MSTHKVINSEVVNDQVDQSKNWSQEMRKSSIWTSSAQNRLALQLKVEAETNDKNTRKVQKGDTLGAIVKALSGNLDWSQSVDYRSSKLAANRRPKVLSKANLIYPDQYVWIENGVIIVADEFPKNEDPVRQPVKDEPKVDPKNEDPVRQPVKDEPKIDPKNEDPEGQPVREEPDLQPQDQGPSETVPSISFPRTLKPIAQPDFIDSKLDSVDNLPNIATPRSVRARVLDLLERTSIHPEVDFSLSRWPQNRNDFMRQVIEETGDAYFSLFHVSEVENLGGLNRPRSTSEVRPLFKNEISQVLAPESRILGVQYLVLTGSGEVLIQSVLDESPAEKSGLKPGDIIVKMNGQTPANLMTQDGFVSSQDSIHLLVKREGVDGLLTKTIVPEKLDRIREADTEEIDDDILMVKGPFGFSESLTEDFESRLRESGRRSIVVDLRNNSGGLTAEANQLSKKLKSLNSQGFKIVILTNAKTASAAEILTADAQEEGWAKVIGQRTYGKHVGQDFRNIGNYIVTFTVGMHRRGSQVPVTPDVEVSSEDALEVAIKHLRPTS